ncbi:class I SAM-dependent methyltransferase [Phenylobacterium sp. SCN 70-31]|uniref:class I SAM-dependent methyltransferase n=1 Tax=Phenylobacterium sp. SCN 70-31 TaxID=1660129 RepID=UPI00086A4BB0|nr:class I SAM-dependent methyltransferase [Phenylobacterium sp. SCN 70-31]ODT86005.1 MAG: methyltransferase [Phenylobacterium sp. SCN 70-31]
MRMMLMAAAAAAILGADAAQGVSHAASQAAVPPHIAAALADKARPDEEAARDAARKPGELLAFAEVKPGQKVADLVMGGGYFTRILSAAVGPQGNVTAYQPEEFIRFQASYGENQKKVAGAYANVTPLTATFADLDLPDGLDLVLTVQNYHDFHLTPFPKDTAAKVNAEVFRSLKPGGLYVIVDHAAVPGSGLEPAMKVHRIDPAIVRQEVEAAGFRFEGDSPLLRDPSDPHTANVFDPAIRGKTDQFVLKFRKPA